MPLSIAIDEPNGFVYIATYDPNTVTQYKATVQPADHKTAAAACKSTVDLKLTAVRELRGVEGSYALTAVAVLSPSTLLLSHCGHAIEVLTHTDTTDRGCAAAAAAGAAGGADCALAGPIGQLRVLESGGFATTA
jgi:hypothetical protein